MKADKTKIIKAALAVLLLAVCAAVCVRYSRQVLYAASEIAVRAAAAHLPSAVFESFEKIAVEETRQTQTQKEKETQTQQTEQEETKAAQTSLQQDDFYKTPDDILEKIEKAKANASKDKKDAAIYEKQYTDEGVTDKAGVVKIKNTNSTQIDVSELLRKKADLSVTKNQPSVLIYHTHTTESYQTLDRDFYAVGSLSRSGDESENMIRVGEAICSELEKAGFVAVHDKTVHDARYSGAYERSKKTVSENLKKYPTIQVTLDIHRDAIQETNGTKIKPTATVNGKKAAQVMIISGCQESGNGIENFPDWRYNLIFAAHLQEKTETLFPGLTRPIFFCPRRYNMNMTRCSLLIEVGSDANTLEEAYFSGKCIGKALAALLEEYTEK